MLMPIAKLCRKHGCKPNGVLHIGAHIGQEAPEYNSLGVKSMHFIEAMPDVYELLKKNISKYPNAHAYNACISDIDEQDVEFKITSNQGQSSSILDFGTHASMHPDVKVVRTIQCVTKRIDTLFNNELPDVDFLNIDLQGAELKALKSMGTMLERFKYAYLEVNREELYIGCALLDEIDMFMQANGFTRVELYMTNFGWGDAFYVKS